MGERQVAIADAGPLIHLDEISSLGLFAVFERVLVPDVVAEEVRRHRPHLGLEDQTIFEVRTCDPVALKSELAHLQAGELAALAMCRSLSVSTVLTDDLAAREAAKKLGCVPVGSIGVILRAAREGRVSRLDARALLQRLGRSSLFTTPALLEAAVRSLGPIA